MTAKRTSHRLDPLLPFAAVAFPAAVTPDRDRSDDGRTTDGRAYEPRPRSLRCPRSWRPARPRPRRSIPRSRRIPPGRIRSEEHTSELQSLMRISYAVFCLKKKKNTNTQTRLYL